MRSVYGVATALGIGGLLSWIAWAAATTAGSRPDPEKRLGHRWRASLAAVVGLGLGGLSASYAGWGSAAAAAAAVAAAGAAAAFAVATGSRGRP